MTESTGRAGGRPAPVAVVFPGEGSQRPGMADPWLEDPASAEVLAEASERLRHDVAASWRNPDVLADPVEAQLAVFVCAVAGYRSLVAAGIRPVAAAGHSLGEYAALVAAGALDFGQVLAVVSVRGYAMGLAARERSGGMVAVVGPGAAGVSAAGIATVTTGPLDVAHENSPQQVVVSGSLDALDAFVTATRALGGRVIRMRVAGAFHSPLMAPAAGRLAAAQVRLVWSVPDFPVITNADGEPTRDPQRLRNALARHLLAPVRWEQTSRALAALGVDNVIECGASRVLGPLVRQVHPDADTVLISGPDDLVSVPESRPRQAVPAQIPRDRIRRRTV